MAATSIKPQSGTSEHKALCDWLHSMKLSLRWTCTSMYYPYHMIMWETPSNHADCDRRNKFVRHNL